MRVVLEDGASHAVDSSDMAFRFAMSQAVREAMARAAPSVLEPIMKLDVVAPQEVKCVHDSTANFETISNAIKLHLRSSQFQGAIVSGLSRRMGLIQNSSTMDDNVVIEADVPLAQMFGYSTDIRSITQGKGEFTMEYRQHQPVQRDQQAELIKAFKEEQEAAAGAA